MSWLPGNYVGSEVERDLIAERPEAGVKHSHHQSLFVDAVVTLELSRRLAIPRRHTISLFMIAIEICCNHSNWQLFQPLE